MSQGTISSEVNKRLCEAFDCFAEATINIKVKVGQQRTITLELCKDCVKQFQDN
jgi:hypothetical protein